MEIKTPVDELKNILRKLRLARDFDAQLYVDSKKKKINDFFAKNELDSAVIGVSGGVDSAITLALLLSASQEPDSPIKEVRALILPVDVDGATGQDAASNKASILIGIMEKIHGKKVLTYRQCDLSGAHQAMVHEVSKSEEEFGETPNAWANGQLVSLIRMPMLYYQAAIMQQHGRRSIVVGTTNRDEGAYIGFFGKTSDGAVDLQPIADIHKSEVYQVAQLLGVPDVITADEARGDVWDGKSTEELMGFPYWFLEMYQLIKTARSPIRDVRLLSTAAAELYTSYAEKIEKWHAVNIHKYQNGGIAQYIDVMEREVPTNSLASLKGIVSN